MVKASGIYQVTVNAENNPTYLRGGLYSVEVKGKQARFISDSGSSSYERLPMLNIFEKQARVVCARVIPFWYRGSLNVDPLQGNGRQTQLEQNICEFESWQRTAQ